jgi:hypothetical protein
MKVGTGKPRNSVVCALVVVSAFGIVSVSGAAAKTVTIGQLFKPTADCVGGFSSLVTGVASGTSYVVPKAGVITSWSWHAGATPVNGLELKVGRSAGGGNYKIVGQANAGIETANTVRTYTAHIPVRAGDLIGIFQNGGNCDTYTGNSMDTLAEVATNVSPGSTALFGSSSRYKEPVSASVSEDCVVPNLKGKTLKAARKALKAHSCTLGTVRPPGQTSGTVKRQRPAAGKVLAPEAKVNIRLG